MYPILVSLLLLALVPASAFAAPPSNDTRQNAQQLQLGQRVNGTTVDATADEDDAGGCGPSDTPSVWYRVDGPRDGRAIVQLQANGDLDVTVDVYERIRSESNSLSCDNSDRNGRASTEFQMRKGRSYLVRVSERARSESGTFSILVDIGQPPASPPGRPLGKGGASGDVQRVFEPSNAYSANLREGRSYRVNLAPDGCIRLSIYGPGASSFEDESPRRVLRCGGYTLFTPGPREGGRYSFLIEPASSRRDPQKYHLQVARAGRDDVTPGRFVRNFKRVRGVLNANRIDVVDIYRFDVVRPSITSLSLKVPGGDDFSTRLITAGGHRVALGGTDDDITVRTKPGRYYVAVRARHGSSGRYSLGRASKTITRTSLQPVPRKTSPGSTVSLRVGVKPAVRGRVTVSYRPPSIGRYRTRAFYNGTRESAESSSKVRFFRVVAPLEE
jgi:hypothetical protein